MSTNGHTLNKSTEVEENDRVIAKSVGVNGGIVGSEKEAYSNGIGVQHTSVSNTVEKATKLLEAQLMVLTHVVINISTETSNKPDSLVRILNKKTLQRALIKGISGEVKDLAFCHTPAKITLAIVDEAGLLHVYEASENANETIETTLILKVTRQRDICEYRRVSWCHYHPDEPVPDIPEDDEMYFRQIVVTHDQYADVIHVDTIIKVYGQEVDVEILKTGIQRLTSHDKPISEAIFAPDGSAVATASLDGEVRFYQVYLFEKEREIAPRCLHKWKPHGGKPVNSLFFLDNHKHSNTCNYLMPDLWNLWSLRMYRDQSDEEDETMNEIPDDSNYTEETFFKLLYVQPNSSLALKAVPFQCCFLKKSAHLLKSLQECRVAFPTLHFSPQKASSADPLCAMSQESIPNGLSDLSLDRTNDITCPDDDLSAGSGTTVNASSNLSSNSQLLLTPEAFSSPSSTQASSNFTHLVTNNIIKSNSSPSGKVASPSFKPSPSKENQGVPEVELGNLVDIDEQHPLATSERIPGHEMNGNPPSLVRRSHHSSSSSPSREVAEILSENGDSKYKRSAVNNEAEVDNSSGTYKNTSWPAAPDIQKISQQNSPR
ncbi:Enhancer of mRNA-decapping protein 4 [Nymphon striatum]|nr:Enhancer of mRNA-decapping protein 4 [Nymphon striatum]